MADTDLIGVYENGVKMSLWNQLITRFKEEKAFSVVEALMALAIMSLVLVALLGLLVTSVKAIAANKLSTVATQVANECIEEIRAKPYDEVMPGTSEETRTVLNTIFTINYDIAWVDDVADGTGISDSDGPQDYKSVSVTVSWVERGDTKTINVSTFIKSKPAQLEPPTVNFIFGDVDFDKTPPNGTIFGLDDSPYKDWFDNGTIPLKATGSSPGGDLVSMRFYVSGITPTGGLYGFDPIESYTNNPTCTWNPGLEGGTLWPEGTHEVVVEVWTAQGGRDAKSIFWIIDKYPPLWKESEPANLSGQPLDIYDNGMSVRLTWQKAWDGTDQVNRYKLYRKDPGQLVFSLIEPDLNVPNATYDDDGLSEWAVYEYQLKALSAGGRESTTTSNNASVTTLFNIEGSSFKDKGKRKVSLQWNTPPEGVVVQHYDIIRNGVVVGWAAGTATQFTDSNNGAGLAEGTFEYRVMAIGNSGNEVNRSISISVYVRH